MAPEEFYKIHGQFTGVSDFGTSLDDILGGKAAPPPQGARIDISFTGSVSGGLEGEMTGVDYLNIRADGRTELNVRGTIVTSDGARIAFEVTGAVVSQPGQATDTITESIKLTTGSEKYAWVNGLHLLGKGVIDPAAGTIEITAYR